MPPRVLLVDNHDSYTGNLLQLLWQLTGDRPDIVESDAMRVRSLAGSDYTHIVLGPGPGSPTNSADVGRTYDLIRATRVPILGVCFGMQTIAAALGARIERLDHPAHGRVSTLKHNSTGLFTGLDATSVERYHSLHVPEPLPAPLAATAHADDGTLMALEAETLALWGVQFHPESIGTADGIRMLQSFLTFEANADRRALHSPDALTTEP